MTFSIGVLLLSNLKIKLIHKKPLNSIQK